MSAGASLPLTPRVKPCFGSPRRNWDGRRELPLKQQFLELVRTFMNVDFSKHPNLITMKRLYEVLRQKGFTKEEAARAAGRLEVSVTDAFVEDKEMFEEVINCYATAIFNMKAEMDKTDPLLFWEATQKPGLSL